MVIRNMDILTFNVRSLVSSSRRIDLINTLKCNKIDVAFLQETRLRSTHRIVLENYSFINDNSSIGVAIALKENYAFRCVTVDSISFPNVFVEIFLVIDGLPKKILFGSIYIPCNYNNNEIYNGLSAVKTISSNYDGVIVGGDFNAKHISWGDRFSNSNGVSFFSWLADFCPDFVRISDTSPSFPNGNSFLDHFLLSTNLVDTFSLNFSVKSLPSFADHFPLHFQLKFLNFEFVLRQPRIITSFRNTDWNSFRAEVTSKIDVDFPPRNVNLTNLEIDHFVDEFSSIVNEVADNHCEKIEIKNKRIFISDKIKHLYKVKYSWQKELRRMFKR